MFATFGFFLDGCDCLLLLFDHRATKINRFCPETIAVHLKLFTNQDLIGFMLVTVKITMLQLNHKLRKCSQVIKDSCLYLINQNFWVYSDSLQVKQIK